MKTLVLQMNATTEFQKQVLNKRKGKRDYEQEMPQAITLSRAEEDFHFLGEVVGHKEQEHLLHSLLD